ncbi:MAG: BtrH N-terminal domain-containing protein [Bacteroidales bacterium]
MNYQHQKAEHCENGAIKNILHHYGWEISENLIFGIGSGIYFIHVPYIRHENMPLSMFRTAPVQIFQNLAKELHIKLHTQRFIIKGNGMKKLDKLLEKEIPVGAVVGLNHLPYFPMELRGEFNGHHIVVYGKEEDRYLISDTFPLIKGKETLTYDELKNVRFTKGLLSPRGQLFYITKVPSKADLPSAIKGGISRSCNMMLQQKIPYFGIKGLYYFADQMMYWGKRYDAKELKRNIRQMVRLLEETGTGGSGFRYLYAGFLEEAASVIHHTKLHLIADQMQNIGDLWRYIAAESLRYSKWAGKENIEIKTIFEIAGMIKEVAQKEEKVFKDLICIN